MGKLGREEIKGYHLLTLHKSPAQGCPTVEGQTGYIYSLAKKMSLKKSFYKWTQNWLVPLLQLWVVWETGHHWCGLPSHTGKLLFFFSGIFLSTKSKRWTPHNRNCIQGSPFPLPVSMASASPQWTPVGRGKDGKKWEHLPHLLFQPFQTVFLNE